MKGLTATVFILQPKHIQHCAYLCVVDSCCSTLYALQPTIVANPAHTPAQSSSTPMFFTATFEKEKGRVR
ncbi:hypothetical protein C1H46_006939 [Malus baccata]|uniref:Uncharacterized protein n=1 Tax=Malus baccata TaxID=106549 RepID=A0A540N8T3_MALBA|nr:hypothetical protein C1H46_006939 [Malus baccata]